jgi:NADH-quinone oxidoreductase subunit A
MALRREVIFLSRASRRERPRHMAPFVPILILMGLAFAFTVLVTVVTFIFGPKKPSAAKLSPYESGIPNIAPPQRRFPVKYLVTGMLFIVFDVEAASLFPLAVLMRRLGVLGLIELVTFVAVLLVAFLYVWRKGAFTWE